MSVCNPVRVCLAELAHVGGLYVFAGARAGKYWAVDSTKQHLLSVVSVCVVCVWLRLWGGGGEGKNVPQTECVCVCLSNVIFVY